MKIPPNDAIIPAKFPKYLKSILDTWGVDLTNEVANFFPISPAVRENMIPIHPIMILAALPFHNVLMPIY